MIFSFRLKYRVTVLLKLEESPSVYDDICQQYFGNAVNNQRVIELMGFEGRVRGANVEAEILRNFEC